MNLRLAEKTDLEKLKTMYSNIAKNLLENQIYIYWSEWYPYADFEEFDIENQNLYVLEDSSEIVGAFCLSHNHENADKVSWNHQTNNACYLSKLGVDIAHLKQGIGKTLITHASNLAKNRGAETLRLFVVDENTPALRLYKKCGFKNAIGTLQEYLDFHAVTLTELPFDLKL